MILTIDQLNECSNSDSVATRQNNDLTLVHMVQNGDKRAFGLLVLKYQHKVAHIASRYVRDSDEVQDISQDTFIRAYRGLKKFRGDSSFYTWLYTIATNTSKNHITRRNRRPTHNSLDIEDPDVVQKADSLVDVADPQSEYFTDEIEATVKDAIRQLPDVLQKTLTLRELDGHSYDEIARIMNCPVGTVRSRLFRARDEIGKRLQPL